MEESEVRRLFGKLKIRTLLDLALIIPSSYEDTRLSSGIEGGKIQTFEAVVKNVENRGSQMRVGFDLPGVGCSITGFFFRVTPYHRRIFRPGSRHVIHGGVRFYKGWAQIVQPRSLRNYGELVPRYGTSVKESEIRLLMKNCITEKALFSEGLESLEVQTLLRLHFPWRFGGIPDMDSEEVKDVLKFVEAYNHLRKLRLKRSDYPAVKSLENPPDSFIGGLPFELTGDQHSAIEEIRRDLSRVDRAARRMIIGDVGSGKTMVILAAAVIAGENRAFLMAPTSILARQLYEEAKRHLPADLTVALVTRKSCEGDYRSADFVIGTHALLYLKDLPPAALVMVDEQHRFGTGQRALLEAMVSAGERRPHYLQFSATPIPRTQAMMQSELVDVSLIAKTPFERNVRSLVIGRDDFPDLLKHIEKEMEKGHQILIVYPLVEESGQIPYQSIEEARRFWEKRYEGVYVTHGRDRNKEEILLEFRQKGRILLATTVIEVGISLPYLTTIVVVGAERLGLATLHQLRGRVGRNGLESRCYLYTHAGKSERLERFCRTASGFEIARLDLEYRNSGDILDGTVQSGQKFRWFDPAGDETVLIRARERAHNVSPGRK